jgi:hypothetical protein
VTLSERRAIDMKKSYETPQIIVTAFEGENSMLTTSNATVASVKRSAKNTASLGQLN